MTGAVQCILTTCSIASLHDCDEDMGSPATRLHKLQQKEEQRHQLAQRAAKAVQEEEEVAWDDDDDVDEKPQDAAAAANDGDGWDAWAESDAVSTGRV